MLSDLKICPFCGGKPRGPLKPPFSGGDERDGYNFVMRITCKCGVLIEVQSHRTGSGWCDDTGQAKAEVVAKWNRRAAIEADRVERDGWKLVPVKPTDEMLVAGTEDWMTVRAYEDRAAVIWRSMIAAAPAKEQRP